LLYAYAKEGWVIENMKAEKKDVTKLLDYIIDHVPVPLSNAEDPINKPFSMAVNTITYDSYFGRMVHGKIYSGRVKVGDEVKAIDRTGNQIGVGKITKITFMKGLTQEETGEGIAGDILCFAGIQAGVSDTVCSLELNQPINTPPIDPPTITMTFGANNSPYAGKDGQEITGAKIIGRLRKETENNVTITLTPAQSSESIQVNGRGELQLGILIEQMRREGFELCVSPPRVLVKKSEAGELLEPIEEVTIDIDTVHSGIVMEKMGLRKGTMIEYKDMPNDKTRIIYKVPSRTFIGFRSEIKTLTHGSAVINSIFDHYAPFLGGVTTLSKGKLIATENGRSKAYALSLIEERGILFIGANEEVYKGMVIGENAKPGDLEVNACRAKKTSNVRAAMSDDNIRLTPPLKMSLEDFLTYMDDDEMLEITPINIRLRKRILDSTERLKLKKEADEKVYIMMS